MPLLIVVIIGAKGFGMASEKLLYYEEQQAKEHPFMACVLLKDVFAGDEITEDMLEVREFIDRGESGGLTVTGAGEIAGLCAKVNISSGTLLTKDMVYEADIDTGDLRYVELTNVYMPELLTENDFIDVRISLPDGEDYIVVAKKRVYELLREEDTVTGFLLRLSENDILRIASAVVDMNTYKDTGIYAVRYIGDHQAESMEFYPVNSKVYSLTGWDPNVSVPHSIPDEVLKRTILEDNLRIYLPDYDESEEDESSVDNERTDRLIEALEIYEE